MEGREIVQVTITTAGVWPSIGVKSEGGVALMTTGDPEE